MYGYNILNFQESTQTWMTVQKILETYWMYHVYVKQYSSWERIFETYTISMWEEDVEV